MLSEVLQHLYFWLKTGEIESFQSLGIISYYETIFVKSVLQYLCLFQIGNYQGLKLLITPNMLVIFVSKFFKFELVTIILVSSAYKRILVPVWQVIYIT